jgi:hypothetical protein
MVRALKLSRIFIPYKFLKFAEKNMEERKISFITYASVDIDKYKKRCWNHGTAIVQRQAQGYAVALRPGDVT